MIIPINEHKCIFLFISFSAPHFAASSSKLKYRQKIYRLSGKVKKLKNILQENKAKVDIDEVFKANPTFLELMKSQIKRYKKQSEPYNDFEKHCAISIYYTCGTVGYK